MIVEAKRRCAGIVNAEFHPCDGRDLSQFFKASFDLILAVDSFPCIVAIGTEIAERYISDAAHMLKPGGTLAIFNYSYRGDIEADRAEISAFAKSAGLEVVRDGSRDLALWDGTSFLLRAPHLRE
jgi:cyclopropane fatty-acyl-phospholipid synthase-like methyltransferase